MHENNCKQPSSSTLSQDQKSKIMDHVIVLSLNGKSFDVGTFIYKTTGWNENAHYAEDTVGILISRAKKFDLDKNDFEVLVVGALITGGPYICYEVDVIKDLFHTFTYSEIINIYHKAGRYESWVDESIKPLIKEKEREELRGFVVNHEFIFRQDVYSLTSLLKDINDSALRCSGGHDSLFESKRNIYILELSEALREYGLYHESIKLLEFTELTNMSLDKAKTIKNEAMEEYHEEFL